MEYFKEHFGVTYAPNTRETVRRQTIHQFVQAGIVIANPDSERPVNSPHTRYQIEPAALKLVLTYGTPEWQENLGQYVIGLSSRNRLKLREREMKLIPVHLPNGQEFHLTGGGQNVLIKDIIEKFCQRFTPGALLLYVGDAGSKFALFERDYFKSLDVVIDEHGKMPDGVVYIPEKNWLILIEAVTSHGPIDLKRHNELKDLFGRTRAGLVFVTAFETRKVMLRYLSEIAWETDVWLAESPDHLIHFNGERFLGPYY